MFIHVGLFPASDRRRPGVELIQQNKPVQPQFFESKLNKQPFTAEPCLILNWSP